MAKGEKPTHHLLSVSGEGEKAQFTRIVALWPTREGGGYTGEIPAGITITGRIFIRAAETDSQAES